MGTSVQTQNAIHGKPTTLPVTSRIPELDGLRGIAILSVVSVHYFDFEGLHAGPVPRFLHHVVALGWSGVDLFFVLSGFLIGGILLDARGAQNYFKVFYARRFFRIIPLYYAWVLLWVLLVTFADHTIQTHSNSGRSLTSGAPVNIHFLFLQNVWNVTFLGLAASWFTALWSLAVEEQFYLICPWIVRLLSRRGLYATLFAIIAVAPVLRLGLRLIARVNPIRIYILTPCRMDALAFGVLAALLWRNETFKEKLSKHERVVRVVRTVLGLGALSLLLWWPDKTDILTQTIGYTWLAMFYTAGLLSVISRPTDWLAKLLRMSWLRSIGTVSYCIYIIHDAVVVLLHGLILKSPPRLDTPKGAVVTLLAALFTYGIARLSWKFFERPLLKRGHRFQYDSVREAISTSHATTSEVVGV